MKIRLKRFFLWLFVATSLGLSGCAGDEEPFPVTVIVDFGAAAKAPVGKEVTVLPGSTVFISYTEGCFHFFLVTNMGVWVLQGCGWGEEAVHPLTFEGLMAVYAAGLPYFYRAMIGDLLYTALFFSGFAIASRSVLMLQEPTHA